MRAENRTCGPATPTCDLCFYPAPQPLIHPVPHWRDLGPGAQREWLICLDCATEIRDQLNEGEPMEPEKIEVVNPELNLGQLLPWIPIVVQAVEVYPQLVLAKAGDEVKSPAVPHVRLAGGRFKVSVSFIKEGD